MSLPEAITEIANDMLKDSQEYKEPFSILLKSYAKQLLTAVKASHIEELPPYVESVREVLLNPFQQAIKREEVKKLERAVEDHKNQAILEESGTRYVEIAMGDWDGTMIPIDNKMPVGAKTQIGGQIYVLKEGNKLYPVEL